MKSEFQSAFIIRLVHLC